MAFDVLNSIHRGRLFSKIEKDYVTLADFRKPRVELIEDYAGDRYGESDRRRRKRLLPLMLQTAQAYTMAMASNNPRVAVSTDRQGAAKGFALRYREALNKLIVKIHMQETLEAVVLDSFFGPGFVKVCMGDSAPVQIENDVWMDPGFPYVGRISLDDWCHDTGAKDFRRCTYTLDRYRVPFDKLSDKSLYDPKVVAKLTPTSKFAGEDNAEDIAHGQGVDPDEFEKMIYLCDVYIPCDNRVYTWAVQEGMKITDTEPLAVLDWEGSETGPYQMLNLGPVPDNIMPTSPGQNLKHLDDLLNSMFRKLDLSARHQKDILLVMKGEEDTGRKARDAKHMDIITTNGNPDQAMKAVSFNGPNAVMQQFTLASLSMFDRMAGNLKQKLGLGQTFETATQEMMAKGEVDQSEAFMAVKMVRFTEAIVRHLGDLLFDDKSISMDISIPARPGLEKFGRPEHRWTPDDRVGDRDDYPVRIEPFSLAYQSPQQRAQKLRMQAQDPIMQMAVQSGQVQFDAMEYLTQLAEMDDMPQYLDIFKGQPMPGRLPQTGEDPLAGFNPNKPNGNYTRTNVSKGGGAGGGNQEALTQMMQTAAKGGGQGVNVA